MQSGKSEVPPIEEVADPGFREKLWRTTKKAVKQVPFVDEVAAAYYCATDDVTPFRTKATIAAALAYFVLPADMIPDFIVGFGFTDDLAVLTAAIAAVSGHIKPEHRESAKKAMETLD